MSEVFLNTEVECESKVKLILNFSADVDANINQNRKSNRQKVFDIDKYKIYKISYIQRFPDHVSEVYTISGRITGITYTNKKANFVNPIIYRSVDKRAPLKLDERLQPSAFTVDCSTQFKNDVRIINIGDIRDFELEDNQIDFSAYTIGDTIKVEMFDGTIYPMCIVKDYYEGEDFTSIIVDYIEPLDTPTEDGSIGYIHRLQFKHDDIKFITMIHDVSDFQFTLGDTVEMTVENVAPTEEDPDGEYETYHGTIMDIVTIDDDTRYTMANVIAILLKYRMKIGEEIKSIVQLFRMSEIVRLLPFEFPSQNPDIVTVADEGYTTSDDPDDIENDMFPDEEVIPPYIEEGQAGDPDAPGPDEGQTDSTDDNTEGVTLPIS